VLDQIKTTIEQTTGTIPKASSQLSNVTQATEMATVEILNVLDRMTGRIEAAEAAVQTLHKGTGNEDPSLQAIGQALADTRQDSMNIAMALQVQDITSQQIASVSHLIESVRAQLLEALGQLGPDAGGGEPAAQGPKATTFDGDAVFTRSTDRQDDADAIIKQWNKVDNE